MGRKSLENRNVRKLTKTGGGKSISVTLPIEYIRELKWKDRQKVIVKKKDKSLIVSDWKPK